MCGDKLWPIGDQDPFSAIYLSISVESSQQQESFYNGRQSLNRRILEHCGGGINSNAKYNAR